MLLERVLDAALTETTKENGGMEASHKTEIASLGSCDPLAGPLAGPLSRCLFLAEPRTALLLLLVAHIREATRGDEAKKKQVAWDRVRPMLSMGARMLGGADRRDAGSVHTEHEFAETFSNVQDAKQDVFDKGNETADKVDGEGEDGGDGLRHGGDEGCNKLVYGLAKVADGGSDGHGCCRDRGLLGVDGG